MSKIKNEFFDEIEFQRLLESDDKEEYLEDMQDELSNLLNSKPESGEEWADICFIESQIVRLQEVCKH